MLLVQTRSPPSAAQVSKGRGEGQDLLNPTVTRQVQNARVEQRVSGGDDYDSKRKRGQRAKEGDWDSNCKRPNKRKTRRKAQVDE
jgi:hypothetical protein